MIGVGRGTSYAILKTKLQFSDQKDKLFCARDYFHSKSKICLRKSSLHFLENEYIDTYHSSGIRVRLLQFSDVVEIFVEPDR